MAVFKLLLDHDINILPDARVMTSLYSANQL